MNKNSEDTIKQNRKFVFEYCGRQGIGLRGHRNDGNIFDNDDFRELLKLMAEIDNNLDTHFRTCAGNATYISKTTKNEFLL